MRLELVRKCAGGSWRTVSYDVQNLDACVYYTRLYFETDFKPIGGRVIGTDRYSACAQALLRQRNELVV